MLTTDLNNRSMMRIQRVKPFYTATPPPDQTKVLIETRFTKLRPAKSSQWIESRPTNVLLTFNLSPSSSSDPLNQTCSDVQIISDTNVEPQSPSEDNAHVFLRLKKNISSLFEPKPSNSNFDDPSSTVPWPNVLEMYIEVYTVEGIEPQPEMIEAVLKAFETDHRTRGDIVKFAVSRRCSSRGFEKRSEDFADSGCSVCLHEFLEGDCVVVTPCKHQFHEACIWRWLWRKDTCPLCRFEIINHDS